MGLLAIVVALILYGTLYPFQFDFDRTDANPFLILLHSWPAKFDRFAVRDAVLNVALFLPLGVTAYLAMARRGKALAFGFAVLLGTTLSACIEMLQVYDAHRSCSAADWLCNTAGAALGAALATEFRPGIAKLRSRLGSRGALVLVACWAGAQLYPAIPLLSRGHLGASWRYLVASPISWVEVFAGAADWYVLGALLPFDGLKYALLAIPLRMIISDRVVSKSDILAGLAALLLWKLLRGRGAAILLAAAIVLRELAPFHFAGPAQAFSWVPFAATIGADRVASVVVILRKAFEYGAMVRLLRRGLAGGVIVVSALGVMEAIQCYLPGRTPEITDSVLALIMALVLRILG